MSFFSVVLRHRRGVAALEFALVGLPMIVLLFGIFELGFDFYAQQALDYALSTAVREIATGSLQNTVTSLDSFKSAAFCPALGSLLPCAQVSVTVTPVAGYSAASVAVPLTNGAFDPSGFQYCPGQPGQLMMAQAVYPAPSFIGQMFPGGLTPYNGQTVRLITSVDGFVNEPYTATAAAPAGC